MYAFLVPLFDIISYKVVEEPIMRAWARLIKEVPQEQMNSKDFRRFELF
jgi:hypothetical protein